MNHTPLKGCRKYKLTAAGEEVILPKPPAGVLLLSGGTAK